MTAPSAGLQGAKDGRVPTDSGQGICLAGRMKKAPEYRGSCCFCQRRPPGGAALWRDYSQISFSTSLKLFRIASAEARSLAFSSSLSGVSSTCSTPPAPSTLGSDSATPSMPY